MKSLVAPLSLLFSLSLAGTSLAVNFEKEILPIFESKCYRCHGNGESKGRFSLDVDEISKHIRSTGQINPGNASRSILIEVLETEDPDDRMPKNKSPLAKSEIELIKKWIDDGASLGMQEEGSNAPEEPTGPQPYHSKWTNSAGKEIEATLTGVEDGMALLDMGDRIFRYPLEQLSQESRDTITKWQAGEFDPKEEEEESSEEAN